MKSGTLKQTQATPNTAWEARRVLYRETRSPKTLVNPLFEARGAPSKVDDRFRKKDVREAMVHESSGRVHLIIDQCWAPTMILNNHHVRIGISIIANFYQTCVVHRCTIHVEYMYGKQLMTLIIISHIIAFSFLPPCAPTYGPRRHIVFLHFQHPPSVNQ